MQYCSSKHRLWSRDSLGSGLPLLQTLVTVQSKFQFHHCYIQKVQKLKNCGNGEMKTTHTKNLVHVSPKLGRRTGRHLESELTGAESHEWKPLWEPVRVKNT